MESKKDNTVQIIYSNRFLDILHNIQKRGSKIASEFLEKQGKNFEVSFVDVSEKEDSVSYITSNKVNCILDKYKTINREQEGINLCWISNRQEQKLTRFINRLFGNKFDQKEIENFVDEYKVEIKGDKTFNMFEIIDGDNVKKFYSGSNYSDDRNGQLQRSCMKYDQCEKFFGLYTENPTKMKMLILKQNDDVIYGRANLWYLDDPNGRIFMDRIYTTYDWQIKLFIDYALKNNYIFKSKQIYGGSVIPVINDGKKENLIMSVNLKPNEYRYYPYVDTLQFYNPKNGILTNDVEKFEDNDYLTLVVANGEYLREEYKRGFGIDNLGRIVNSHFLIWSDIDKVYIHRDNVVEIRHGGKNVYVTRDHDFINIDGIIYLKSDVVYDEEQKKWIIKKNI